MVVQVPETPQLPTGTRGDPRGGVDQLMRALYRILTEHAFRLNRMAPRDGSEGPIVLASYAIAGLPDAASYTGGLVFVINDVGGPVPAYSDGSKWLRVTDGSEVSTT